MNNQELTKIQNIVERMKETATFSLYGHSYAELMKDAAALALIDEYKTLKSEYAEVIVDGGYGVDKEQLKEQLLQKKAMVNRHLKIKNYFVAARAIDFFIDDLNYEINQLLEKSKKKHHV